MSNEITRSMKYIKDESNNIIENNEEKKVSKHPILKKIILTILCIIILFFLYTNLIGTSFIITKEYKVESSLLPTSFHGLKIIHFSDIHYGTKINKNNLDKIVTKINKLKPDIIFFTGDLIDKNISITDDIINEVSESLNNLDCTLYKYAIYGDEDLKNDKYQEILTNTDFILLDNESKLLYFEENIPIMISGYNILNTNPDYSILTSFIDEIDVTNLYKIVLIHEPDSIDNFINYNPNLVLAGHSLGGIINIPGIKNLLLPENSQKYYENYYKLNNSDFYISNGLGTSTINLRFNNHPSINLYRIYKTT